MTLVFWFSVALIAYVYVGYPVMLRLWAGLRWGHRRTASRPRAPVPPQRPRSPQLRSPRRRARGGVRPPRGTAPPHAALDHRRRPRHVLEIREADAQIREPHLVDARRHR